MSLLLWIVFAIVQLGMAILLAYLLNYIKSKGANLATKEDVQDITDKVESVKLQYGSQLHIHQVRYEHEFQILRELTEKLVDLRDATLALRPSFDFISANEPEDERKRKRLIRYDETGKALYRLSEIRRPFYPEEIYKLTEEVAKAAWSEAVQYQEGERNREYWKRAMENAERISSLANQAIDAIRDRVKTWERWDTGPQS